MTVLRSLLFVTLGTVLGTAAACGMAEKSSPSGTPGISDVLAAPAPAPGVLNPTRVKAAFFEDDLANIDLVQVMAWDDSSHTGVFITVPATMAAQTGSYPLTSTDVGVTVKYGVSRRGEDDPWDRQWFFTHYSATLIVTTAGLAPGDRIGVVLSNGVFVFEDRDGNMNGAVTATLQSTAPMGAEMDDDEISINDCE